jgi:ABC-type transporter Mla subunit MlaD
MAEGSSGGIGVVGVLIGALIVIVVGGGLLFATGKIGGGGGNTTTLKVEMPKVSAPAK